MTEPTAPAIPAEAPKDVKDFFECRGSTLNWQSGDVTWLGLKVTPSVTFAPGANPGEVNLMIGILGGMVSFTLPASVNAAGELVVDTSSVPDLSEWGLGGRADIDAAIKRINDWFKHNGKKLRPARLVGGTVVLEKVPIAPAAVGTPIPTPVVPKPVTPVTPAPPPATTPSQVSGCLLGILLFAMLVGVVALGGGIGYVLLGSPGPAAQATATPMATPSSPPTASPTPRPTPTPSLVASAIPTASATPTSAASPSASPGLAIAAACVRVVHQAVGDFVSYLDSYVYMYEEDIAYLEVIVEGANNGNPAVLEYDSPSGAYHGILGLHAAGAKKIIVATLVLADGSEIDVTDDLAAALGGKTLVVRYPQQDTFGTCPN